MSRIGRFDSLAVATSMQLWLTTHRGAMAAVTLIALAIMGKWLALHLRSA